MTDYEQGYEQGKADATKKMHPEIRKCLEDYFDKCFEAYQEEIEVYVQPPRQWVGLTDEEIEMIVENRRAARCGQSATPAQTKIRSVRRTGRTILR